MSLAHICLSFEFGYFKFHLPNFIADVKPQLFAILDLETVKLKKNASRNVFCLINSFLDRAEDALTFSFIFFVNSSLQ